MKKKILFLKVFGFHFNHGLAESTLCLVSHKAPKSKTLEVYIQIKIAMSKDKLRILIKILAESHMAFDWEIKSTFGYTPTDQPYSISSSFQSMSGWFDACAQRGRN